MSWLPALWKPLLLEGRLPPHYTTPIAPKFTWRGYLNGQKSGLNDCLAWMRRARAHAEKLCRCYPQDASGNALTIAEWAERWPQDYAEAKIRAGRSLEKIDTAIDTIERLQP
jgi:hypothetical protein